MKKWKVVVILGYCFLVAACGNQNIDAAKKAVEINLTDPSSVQYRNVKAYSEDIVCGDVNAKNKMGGYVGFEPFIFNGRKLGEVQMKFVTTVDQELWCNNNPQKRLTDMKNELPGAENACKHVRDSVPFIKDRICSRVNELKAGITKTMHSGSSPAISEIQNSTSTGASAPVVTPSLLPSSASYRGSGVLDSGNATDVVVIKAHGGSSWVEIIDAQGVILLRKTVANGEIVGASGPKPLTVLIGRADRAEVQVHGKPYDITRISRENVARFEIK